MYVEEMGGVRWGERVKVSMLCPKTREGVAIYVRRGDGWCGGGLAGVMVGMMGVDRVMC